MYLPRSPTTIVLLETIMTITNLETVTAIEETIEETIETEATLTTVTAVTTTIGETMTILATLARSGGLQIVRVKQTTRMDLPPTIHNLANLPPQEGSHNDNTEDHGASNNLAASSDSGSENSDQINPIENSAGESGIVDTPESNDSSSNDNSTSQSNAYVVSDPDGLIGDSSVSIYSVSISNYSSNQDTQNPVVETWLLIMAPSKFYLQTLHHQKKGVTKLTNQTTDYPTNRRPLVCHRNLRCLIRHPWRKFIR